MATQGYASNNAGDVHVDKLHSLSTLEVDTTSTLAGTVTVGGGYGSTGVTLTDAGVVQMNGALTVDGASTLTGAVEISGGLTCDTNKFTVANTSGNAASAGSILSTSATAGVGYGTGAGGTATQGTSKSTGVTLSKVCGTITTHAAELADATTVSFAVTNTAVAATDVVVCSIGATGATAGAYQVWANEMGAGSFTMSVRNVSGGALSEAIPINFIVLKGVTS